MKAIPESSDVFPHLDDKPKLPRRFDDGIGIVGTGGIVNCASARLQEGWIQASEPPTCCPPGLST